MVVSATVFAQTPAFLSEYVGTTSPTYVRASTGWTFQSNESTSPAFFVVATNGSHTLVFNLWSPLASLVTGAAVGIDVTLGDGPTCGAGDSPPDARVRDVAFGPTGAVSRLDLSYAIACGGQTAGYIFGDVTLNETATTALQSEPRELFLPPTGVQSVNRAYPVQLTSGTARTQAVAAVRVRGADAAYFTVSGDTCSGHTVTSTSPCVVGVTYRPHAGEDTAQLVALDAAGRVLSSTPLDAALLPGTSYWTSIVPGYLMRTFQGSTTGIEVGMSGPGRPGQPTTGPSEIQVALGSNTNDELELLTDGPIVPGVYTVGRNAQMYASLGLDGRDFGPYTGVVRITAANFARTDRGLDPMFDLDLTFALTGAGAPGQTFYGAIGYNTSTQLRAPNYVRPQRLADFNADFRTDVAVFRPATGAWYIDGAPTSAYGRRGDVPVPGDYLAPDQSSKAVYRPSSGTWYIQGQPPVTYGRPGDVPVPGDYNGDGITDIAVYRPSTGQWWIHGRGPTTWGTAGDKPVSGDFDGNGRTDIAVYRPSTGQWWIQGRSPIIYGIPGDQPVGEDYNGDGATDIAVYRASTGQWWIRGRGPIHYGQPGDIPAPGDYSGTGLSDIALFRPSTGAWYIDGLPKITYGQLGDIPV